MKLLSCVYVEKYSDTIGEQQGNQLFQQNIFALTGTHTHTYALTQ